MALNMKHKPDVVLEVDGVKFPCKRDELARQSPYFAAMFGNNFVEKHKDIIPIQGVDADAMQFLLHWIGDASQIDSLRGEEVLVVLQAAAMLQFENLQQTCEEVMVQRWLSPESCLLTAATADQLSLHTLYQKASALALWHFAEVRHTQAFLDLPIEAVEQYLMNDALSLGPNEDEFLVFEAVSGWLEHKMSERCSDTIRALACVRLSCIPICDIRNMLNYACVNNCNDAQKLLECVLCLRENHQTPKKAETERISVEVQDETLSTIEEEHGCCDTLKRIADHIKSCSSESSANISPEQNDKCLSDKECDSPAERFSSTIIAMAQNILHQQKRRLPKVACIIGHFLKSEKNVVLEETSSASHYQNKKNKKEKVKSGTPYLFYWDEDKSERPIPLLPLSKIDEGPTEALGYTVVSRGQELYVIGGEYLLGYGDWNKSIWKYNVWNETWAFETSLAVPRRHHFVVCLDDDMYVIGGCGRFRVIMDSVDRYNFISKTWHRCAPLPSSLYSAATCVHHNLIYVISCQVFCYYASTNSWITLSDVKIPSGSSFNTAMPFGEHIYLTGLYSSDLMCFDPLGDKSIIKVGSFQNPAGNACLVGEKIYSFTECNESPCVEMYDILNNTFKILWQGTPSDDKISFKKLGGCFPLVLYETLWHNFKSL